MRGRNPEVAAKSPQGPAAAAPPEDRASGAARLSGSLTLAATALFALAAPFSIFATQTAVALLVIGLLADPRPVLRGLRARPGILAAVGFYFLVQALAILYSQHPLRSLLVLKGDLPVLLLPLFLAALDRPGTRRVALPLLWGSLALAGLLGAVQYATGSDPFGRAELEPYHAGGFIAVGTLGGHLTYAGVLMLGCAAAWARLLAARGRERAWALGLLLLTGAGLLASFARSAWLGVAGGALLSAVATAWLAGERDGARARPLRRIARVAIAALALASVAAAAILLVPGVAERLGSLFAASDLRGRLWGTALRIFADFPLFGAGLGGFQTHFEAYRLPGTYQATCHPHNDWLNTLAHSGLAGALALATLWATLLRAGLSPDRPARARVLLLGLVATFLLAGLGQCYFTDEEPAMALWFLIAAALTEPAASTAGMGRPSSPARASSRSPLRLPGRALERRAKNLLLPLACRIYPARRAAPRPLAQVERLLLVRQDNRLGNLVLLSPFLQALRAVAPRAHIGIVTGDFFGHLLEGSPWIDELIIERKRWLIRHPAAYPGHLRRIRSGAWEIAFELSNVDTHSFYNAFLTQVSGAPARVGFDHPRSRRVLDRPIAPPPQECHYSLAPLMLLAALGVEPPLRPLALPPGLAPRCAPREDAARPILLHPGGRGAKRWPTERFAALIAALRARGHGPLAVIAGPREAALLEELRARLGADLDARALRSLEDLAAQLAGAALYVGCDAGPLHVAAAAGVPTISLFLASHPLRYAPLGERHTALLLGATSRAAAEAEREPYPAPAASAMRPPAEFTARLCAQRPRCARPPAGAGPDEEIRFILARIEATLQAVKGGPA